MSLDKMYTLTGAKRVLLPKPRMASSSVLYFSKAPIAQLAGLSAMYVAAGHTPEVAASLLKATACRPVYAVPGRGNRLAVLVGPPGATDNIPLNTQWFRDWLKRGMNPDVAAAMATGDFDLTYGAAKIKWDFGPSAVAKHPFVFGSGGGPAAPSQYVGGMMDLYGQGVLGQGYLCVETYRNPGSSVAGARALAGQSAGYHMVRTGYATVSIDANQAPSVLDSASMTRINERWCHHDFLVESVSRKWRYEPISGSPYTSMSVTMLARSLSKAASIGLNALPVDVNAVGSVFPFPCASRLIGYCVGLPHDTGIHVIEIEGTTNVTDAVIARVSLSLIDYTGACYKKMFPVASLPQAAQADALLKLSELPNDVWFRTAIIPAGLKYGSVSYDSTVIARDASRADGSLDELFYELTDDSPSQNYTALGALSLVAISKKKNDIVTVALAADDADFVSPSAIAFSRNGSGVIVATQNGFSIGSGEALVSIKTGASYSVAGVTLDETAIAFFLLPSWAAVLETVAQGAEDHVYRIDEHVCTSDLRFDGSDDQLARAMPLLLGFDQYKFSSTIASIGLGVQFGELLPADVRYDSIPLYA